jgi:hypothetical protein
MDVAVDAGAREGAAVAPAAPSESAVAAVPRRSRLRRGCHQSGPHALHGDRPAFNRVRAESLALLTGLIRVGIVRNE